MVAIDCTAWDQTILTTYGQGPKNEGEPGLDITFEVPKPLMNVVEGAGTAPPDDHVGE